MYSSPPIHGAAIATAVLADPALRVEWERELEAMAMRIQDMRGALVAALRTAGAPGDWSHITSQVGALTSCSFGRGGWMAVAVFCWLQQCVERGGVAGDCRRG